MSGEQKKRKQKREMSEEERAQCKKGELKKREMSEEKRAQCKKGELKKGDNATRVANRQNNYNNSLLKRDLYELKLHLSIVINRLISCSDLKLCSGSTAVTVMK